MVPVGRFSGLQGGLVGSWLAHPDGITRNQCDGTVVVDTHAVGLANVFGRHDPKQAGVVRACVLLPGCAEFRKADDLHLARAA